MCSDLKYTLKKVSLNYKCRFVFVLYLFQKYPGLASTLRASVAKCKKAESPRLVEPRWDSLVYTESLVKKGDSKIGSLVCL